MIQLLKTRIGRLRILGYLEGISLLLLVFLAVPAKYYFGNPSLTKLLGPVHGAIFLLFMLNTVSLGIEHKGAMRNATWKILLACFIPFGTIYIDNKILKNIKETEQ